MQPIEVAMDGEITSDEPAIFTIGVLPITTKELGRDPLLSRVLHAMRVGWSKHCEEEALCPFWSRRLELTVEGGCIIMWGSRDTGCGAAETP